MKYTAVSMESVENFERLVLRGVEAEGEYIHDIPVQAVANRMELFGLESVEQTLEYIGREAGQPERAQELIVGVSQSYNEVVQSEFAQSLMPQPVADLSVMGQTLMSPLRIADHKRSALTEHRSSSLQLMGMRSVLHSRPALRMMDDTRPVEATVPAASEALDAEPELITRAVKMVQEMSNLLEAWRLETVMSYVPQMRAYLKDRESLLARV